MSRSSVGHDRRFIDAWTTSGFEVSEIATGGDSVVDLAQMLRERVEEFRPDIVQVGPVTDPAWDLIQVWDGPLIATSWGFDLLQDVDQKPAMEQKARTVLERANLLFVDNDASRKRATALGFNAEHVAQFPWGLDDQWFRERDVPAFGDPEKITILCTRRHESIYRVGEVLEAFLEVAPMSDSVHLTLIGSGSLTPTLKAKAAVSGLPHRIEFLGEVDNARLPEIYRHADIYVTASEVDGTSVSLLEAMASGAVVVASLNEGNQQWVSDDTGYGFEVGDVAALTGILLEMVSVEPGRTAKSERRIANSRELVKERAQWRSTVQEFPGFARSAIKNWECA